MRPDRQQDWLEYWAKWGTTASSRMLEVALWQAVNWREEALALQMLLEWYGQSDDYLFLALSGSQKTFLYSQENRLTCLETVLIFGQQSQIP